MAGDVLFKSYATALVDGDLSGQITADSYFNLVVTGKFTGRINTSSYAMVYLMGGFDGEMEIERSKVFIAGRTTEAQLAKIRGPGMVFLESSDLAPGVHKIGKLEVTVTPAAAKPFDDTPYAGADDSTHDQIAGPPANPDNLLSVPFVVGASRFENGDTIKIIEVRGTAETFQPGNEYWIKGTYTLGSRDRATLGGNVTAESKTNAVTPHAEEQSTEVARGHGEFQLKLPILGKGWPHVSFYPAGGGNGFGGVYFGTGDSVLENWSDVYGSDDTRPAESHANVAHAKFPTLEDQKLADVAWKGLGVELESLGEKDLQRVKTLGYGGGVRVASTTDRAFGQPLEIDDLLVGLHVWPTTSLKDVAAVLTRDDIAELSPLKFYIVRPDGILRLEEGPLTDKVVTGRITVNPPKQTSQSTPIKPRPVVAATPLPIPLGSMKSSATDAPSQHHVDQALANDSKLTTLNHELMSLQYQLSALNNDLSSIAGSKGRLRLKDLIADKQREIEQYRQKAREQPGRVPEPKGLRVPTVPNAVVPSAQLYACLNAPVAPVAPPTIPFEPPSPIESSSTPVQNAERAPTTANNDRQPALRYDGKTFDEWRNALQTELNTKDRADAVAAIASFGASGRGREATEAIVAVVGQYDLNQWLRTSWTNKDSGDLFLNMCLSALGAPSYQYCQYRIPSGDSIPVLVAAAESEDVATRRAITRILLEWQRDRRAIDALMKLTYDPDSAVRKLAILGYRNSKGTEGSASYEELLEYLEHVAKNAQSPDLVARAKLAQRDVRESMDSQRRANRIFGPSASGTQVSRDVPNGKTESRAVNQPTTGSSQHPNTTLSRAAKNPFAAGSQGQLPEEAAESENSRLRYDGKTFEEWRTAWQTELSTEKRLETVKALAAFGASGQGKEATEAILAVVADYDWPLDRFLSTHGNNLSSACLAAFVSTDADTGARIPNEQWLPIFLHAIEDGASHRQKAFMLQVLALNSDSPPTELLDRLAQDGDPNIKSVAEVLRKSLLRPSDSSSPATKE